MTRRKQTGTMVQELLFSGASTSATLKTLRIRKRKLKIHVVHCAEQVNSVMEHLCSEDNFRQLLRRAFPQYLQEEAGWHQKWRVTTFFLRSFLFKSASLPLCLRAADIILTRTSFSLSLHVLLCHYPCLHIFIVILFHYLCTVSFVFFTPSSVLTVWHHHSLHFRRTIICATE